MMTEITRTWAQKNFTDDSILDLEGMDLLFPFLRNDPLNSDDDQFENRDTVDFAAFRYCAMLDDDLLSNEDKKEVYVASALMYWTSQDHKERCTWGMFKKLTVLPPLEQLRFLF